MTTQDEEYTLLRSAVLQNAASIRIARERAEQRQEAYWAEAQRLSHTGSFGWKVSTGEIVWSEETFRIFQLDTEPTVERVLQRAHPEDAALLKQTIERASQDGKDFEHEYRLVMPDGLVKHVHVVARATSDASGELEFVGAVMDVTEQRRARAELAGEKQLLEMIARGDSRAAVLDALCRLVEELASGSLSSILLLDPKANCLRHGAAPSLPIAYTQAIDGAVIGPSVGSCGTAAYRGEPVMVSDIATDPLWADYRDLALAHGLRACWSTPILSSGGKVLGTFAIYYREPRSPTAQEQNLTGQITHLASIAIERQQAEEVLRERARLLDLTRDTVFVRDMNDTITYWNLGAEELYGWNREQAVGKVTHQLTQTVFPAPLAEINAELLRTGRWEGELIHTKRDGTQVVVASRWALQRDERGNAIAILETNNDITERKREEAELLHKTALLDELFEGSPDAVVLMDLEARVLRISREFAALFGYAAEEAAGRSIVDLIVPEDELEDSRAGFARVRSGERFVVERERRRKDGTRIHVSIKRAPIVLGGKPIGYYAIYRDITERKRAEEAQRAQQREREEMQRQLQQAAKMEAIGRLAGGIAHDFNNILGAILGYGELAQKNLEGRAVRRHVDQVMQAGARGKGLVERILAFSRSGLGERVPVHVQSVVEETLEILAASLLPQVRLEKRLDAGDTAVVGDATQLHQVAMNLFTNALQAMEHGGVLTVLLDRESVPERRVLSHGTLLPGPYVRLSVSDTGSGIPPAVLERMFDPFFTTKGVGDGTGLGLSLVHGIVADFGGAIDVRTQAGAGTTFTVWLPASGETPRLLAEPAGELPLGNGETVMIVDDQRSLVALAEETLAALGYEPAGFDSSVAALEAFRAEPQRYDLVLTDETMPDLSGVDLTREIRRVRPELPIVLMSGYSGAQLSERARAVGAAELLRKPLVRRDIAEALARALRSTNS